MKTELAERKRRFERWLETERDLRPSTAKRAIRRVYRSLHAPHGDAEALSGGHTGFPSRPTQQDTGGRDSFLDGPHLPLPRRALPRDDRRPVELSKPSKRRAPPEFLVMDEVHGLLFACSKVRDYALLKALLYGGLRASEVCNLNVSDWDAEERTLTVREGKGGTDRVVRLSEKVNLAFRDWVMERRMESGPLFLSRRGGRLAYATLTRIVKKWAREAGIERNMTAHMPRHTLATHAIRSGMAITDVQARLGHADPKTTII